MPRSKSVPAGKDIKKAADIIRRGGVIIYPTETVYGLGASIFSEDALRRVFEIKKRIPDRAISVAVSSFEMVEELAYVGERERRFIEKLLPGPVTVLLEKKKAVPDTLTPDSSLVGIRYPDHRMATELVEMAGVPITSTSANVSGEQPPRSVEDVKISADYILDGGVCGGEPSTVVDLINMKIVRRGAGYEKVMAVLGEIQKPL